MSGTFSAESLVMDNITVTNLLQRPLDRGAAASLPWGLVEAGPALAQGSALEVT